ncbi:MAG: replicative DNA helicase [Planctomycetota bacterium]|nr:MAG: replicative DNA helicase [Planctomycetota bacterium]REJ90271.1 MAG: replicative DNA helicase [Planctomycetota bacterium]REK17782.1 MAG: replicative DNA helicase [Planctomycetota bacterium]REK40988.1 MAG: replicative DNA helicase [Planctomycetota bacterium]
MATAPQATARSATARRSASGDDGLFDRQPPANLEAERNMLGSILLVPEVCDDIALIVRAEDLYDDAHQKIFRQMLALHEASQRIDVTLLIERLKSAGEFESVGGAATLAELAQSVPTAANAEYYARIVHDKANLRNLIRTTTEIIRDAYEQAESSREMLNRAEERIFAIRDERDTGTLNPMKDVLLEAFEEIDARMKHGGASGLSTGFGDLDRLTGGLHGSELIIIAGRPSMGKTALAANIAEYVAVEADQTTLFVSLEMSRLELVQRIMCSSGEISGEKFRSGYLSADDHQKLIEVSAKLGKSPMFIDDSPSRTVTEIAATARRLKRREGLSLIVLDYLQLIQPDDPSDPRQEQVAKMARRLKVLAREMEVPVICLAQLNRQAEMTKDNRPKLSHLRESGAIEQDADVVMMVHREEYYLSAQERQALKDQGNPNNILGEADVIVAKQRNGPTGEVKLHWFQQFTRFKNAEMRSYDEFEQYGVADEF